MVEKNHDGEKMNNLIKTNTVFNPAANFVDALWDDMTSSLIRPNLNKFVASLKADYFVENNEVYINVDVAGATPEDVVVTYDKEYNSISVKVAKQYTKKETKPEFVLRERVISDQCRVFRLPSDIDSSTISADVKNGLLTVKAQIQQKDPEASKVTIKVNG